MGAVGALDGQAAPALAGELDVGVSRRRRQRQPGGVLGAQQHRAVGPADLKFEPQVAAWLVAAQRRHAVRQPAQAVFAAADLAEDQLRGLGHQRVDQFLHVVARLVVAERGGQPHAGDRGQHHPEQQAAAQRNRALLARGGHQAGSPIRYPKPRTVLDDVRPELLAQEVDIDLDRVAFRLLAPGIKAVLELGARADLVAVAHQVVEQRVLAGRELDRLAVERHPPGGRLEHQRPVGQRRRRRSRGTADQRAHARLQFAEVEGLGQVIVGAGVEPGDLVGAGIARGEHEDRQRACRGCAVRAARSARRPWAAQGRGRRRRIVVEQGAPGVFAVAHPVDRVIGQLQSGANAVAEQDIVFNQQDPQLLPFLGQPGEQRLDFLTPAAVGQFAARTRRRLERCVEVGTRFRMAAAVGQILAVKEIRVNPGRVDGQRLLEVLLGASPCRRSRPASRAPWRRAWPGWYRRSR